MLSVLTIVLAAAPALAVASALGPGERVAAGVSPSVSEEQPRAPSVRAPSARGASSRVAPSRSTPPPTGSSGGCVAVEAVPPAGGRSGVVSRGPGRRQPRVSVAETVDLQLQVRIRPVLRDDHVLRLELFTPRGYLYQTMTLPFRFVSGREPGERGGERTTRSVAGFPRPLDVQLLTTPRRRRPAADRVTARLPVAGTSIALGSLLGEWTAVPYIDDQAAPCGPAGSFVIAE